MSGLQAVIWDFDGTLVDTEPVWGVTEQEMLAEHGVTWGEEDMAKMVGQSARISAAMMAEAAGRPDLADAMFDELHERMRHKVASNPLPYLPGVEALIAEIAAAGIRGAVVTASFGPVIDAARDRLPGNLEFIVTADDVTCMKPHPEAYLQAFGRLGIHPDDALVLEDSVPGVTSALAAGAYVVAVPAQQEFDPHARLHVLPDRLATTDLARLHRVWRAMKETP